MEKIFVVYIMASARRGTLYIGVTSNLPKRVWEHREGIIDGFTKKYGVKDLVWYEVHEDPVSAITKEKQLKKWNRAWKLELIETKNPEWNDLFEEICA
jgi:putative endonuclease